MLAIKSRVIRIQQALGVDADGIVGPVTLAAAEQALGIPPVGNGQADHPNPVPDRHTRQAMTPSLKGVNKIIGWEVGGESYYNRRLTKPTWPGGASGVTIGIGYDVGMNTASQVQEDWTGKIPDDWVQKLMGATGITGPKARVEAKRLADAGIGIPWEAAKDLFSEKTLGRYAKLTLKTFPGVEKLPHDAQAAMLSLVFNRGSSLSGSRRKEMRDLVPAVAQRNLDAMASLFIQMKRLWVGKGLDGLLRRRDEEADLILNSDHLYGQEDYIVVQ